MNTETCNVIPSRSLSLTRRFPQQFAREEEDQEKGFFPLCVNNKIITEETITTPNKNKSQRRKLNISFSKSLYAKDKKVITSAKKKSALDKNVFD